MLANQYPAALRISRRMLILIVRLPVSINME